MLARRAWLVALGAVGTASIAYVLVVRILLEPGPSPGAGLGWLLFGVLPLYAFGLWLLTATSARVALYVALGGTGSAVGSAYETFVLTNPEVTGADTFALVNQIGLTADAVAALGFLLMIAAFPDGVLEKRWQRVAVHLSWFSLLVGPATLLTFDEVVLPEYVELDVGPIPNPYAVSALAFLRPVVDAVLLQWWVTPLLLVVVFYARGLFSGPARRAQMRFMVIAVTCTLVTYMLWESTRLASIDGTPFGTASTIAVAVSMISLPIAGIHGILRYGAFDVAVADRGRVVIRSSATLITILYGWAVAALGVVLSDAVSSSAAVLLTAVVAVALLPVRGWLSRGINRLVVGNREESLAQLGDLGARLEQAVDVDDVLTRLARAVRDGLGATWVRISLAAPDGRSVEVARVVAGTVVGEPVTGADLTRADAVLGRIDLGPARSGSYGPAELALLDTVARQATTAVANARLTAELADQLDELAASRSRLITAQDAERRKIERDLHDGVQQSVVALITGLRLARNRLDRGDLRREELSDLQDQAREVIADLRELAHGIHPQVLSDGGLVAAVESRTTRYPVPLTIEADDTVRTRRFGTDVETVAFYTVREALANVAKHAQATAVHVSIRVADAALVVEVGDDGIGFTAPGADAGAGLANIRDRVAAVGGRVRLDSTAGGGTRLLVELPLEPSEPSHPPCEPPPDASSTRPTEQPEAARA